MPAPRVWRGPAVSVEYPHTIGDPLIAWFLASLVVLVVSGVAAQLVSGRTLSRWIGASGAMLGCVVGFASAVPVLLGAPASFLRLPWTLPLASFSLGIDPLSALFLLPTLGIGFLAALYGLGYERDASTRTSPFWMNLLLATMGLLTVARNGVLFLIAWEAMTIASYFLVTTHHERADVRRAGRIYLFAAHAGTAFLLVMFLLLGRSGTLDFETFLMGSARAASEANTLFLLALLGFGVKAGLMPLHVWLPEAHPAAPTHVSALMSGAMIKLGIYGLLRTLTFLGAPPLWWGWTLILIGLVTGILGVLYALAQRELKRLLAYSSVENMGIVAMGIGLGAIGVSRSSPILAGLGFGAALLHVLNHAAFKSLLFFGAGAVIRSTGIGSIEGTGGLWKRMPATGAAFLVGAAAIAALPPLNGFVSEFLLLLGSFSAVGEAKLPVALAGIVSIAGLALIGGLAAACFAMTFGIVFLGTPRSKAAAEAHEAPVLVRVPVILLAGACLVLGLASPLLLPPLARVLFILTPGLEDGVAATLLVARPPLLGVAAVGGAWIAFLAACLGWRAHQLRRRTVRETATWSCGYALTTPRVQYTASSFAQPLLELFAPMLGTRVSSVKPLGLFPHGASLETTTPDSFRERVFRPVFEEIDRTLARFRRIQEGRVQVYVLYIAITLVALLVIQFARNP